MNGIFPVLQVIALLQLIGRDKGFLQGWETISNETKKILINEACVSCRYRPICNTCAAAALLETGNYDGIPEYICEYTKEFYRIMKEGARIC